MLSKMAYLIHPVTTVKAEGVAKLYFELIYPLLELLKAIVWNRDIKLLKHSERVTENG